jgi:putative ABC transport system permease protein
MQQSLIVGLLGLAVGLPIVSGLSALARWFGTHAVLPPWLLGLASTITLSMALLAGLYALRSLKDTEPAQLLR